MGVAVSLTLAERAVARRYRYIAYSRRYHQPNALRGDASDYSYQLHAADLAALIAELRSGPVHLVGNSYGAAVALLVALDHPALVRRAVLNEPGSLFPHLVESRPEARGLVAERARAWAEMRETGRSGDMERAAELLFDWLVQEAGGLRRIPEERRRPWLDNARTVGPMLLQSPPPTISCAALGAIQVPVLVLRGERTVPFYAATNDALFACLPRGNGEAVVPAAGHFSYAESPAAYADALFRFLGT